MTTLTWIIIDEVITIMLLGTLKLAGYIEYWYCVVLPMQMIIVPLFIRWYRLNKK